MNHFLYNTLIGLVIVSSFSSFSSPDRNISSDATFVCKGIVVDGNTKKPLAAVCITKNADTLCVQSDATGNFKITVQKDTKVWFRLRGYTWVSIKVTDAATQTISLYPKSKSNGFSHGLPGQVNEMIFDGNRVPKEDWDSFSPEDIGNIEFKNGRIIITSK
jgi:hypothetical protein